MVSKKKKVHCMCEDGIEEPVPSDYRLSSLSKSCDANW